MPYAQFVQTVSRKWVLDAQAAESLAKQTRQAEAKALRQQRAAEWEARFAWDGAPSSGAGEAAPALDAPHTDL